MRPKSLNMEWSLEVLLETSMILRVMSLHRLVATEIEYCISCKGVSQLSQGIVGTSHVSAEEMRADKRASLVYLYLYFTVKSVLVPEFYIL